MTLSIIVAVAKNGVIGVKNDLPWYLPADLKHFKKITTGHHILMGRKTYESIGKPLPNRTTVIITRNKDYEAAGCLVANELEQAIAMAKESGESEAFLIGGGQLYQLAMEQQVIDKIYLTEVHTSVDGDTFFPEIMDSEWKEISRERHEPEGKNPFAYSFVELLRQH